LLVSNVGITGICPVQLRTYQSCSWWGWVKSQS
jgi:hypothetical protein